MSDVKQSNRAQTIDGTTHVDDAAAPGRTTRSGALVGPNPATPSGLVMRKRDGNGVAEGAGDSIAAASSGSGAPLPTGIMRKFEASLGADLSGVRVHTDGASADAASAVGAKAYTTGNDIHFGAGYYEPSSTAGEHLLAHEVAHTVQQAGGVRYKLEVSAPGDAFELEADRAADAMVSGRSAPVSPVNQTGVARDVDDEMVREQGQSGDLEAKSMAVQVINAHTTVDDEREAEAVLAQIDAAEGAVSRHPMKVASHKSGDGGLPDPTEILVENHDARFAIEEYLATVSESGNFQSQYAASYQTTKKDYGAFMGLFGAFLMAGGQLKDKAQVDKMAELSKDEEFKGARAKFEGVRDELVTDKNVISQNQGKVATTSAGLMQAIHSTRAAAAGAKADKKQGELNTLLKTIDEAVSTIMTVGKIVSSATTGVLALGSGGVDMEKMVESSPEIAPGAKPSKPSLAPPDLKQLNRASETPQLPEDPVERPGSTTTYALPSQTMATAKSLGEKAVGALGGPDKMLKTALTMLEQSKIDAIQSQIAAANEDKNLENAASAAAGMAKLRGEYSTALTTIINNVGNLLDHKKQMDAAVERMVAAAKKRGASKDVTGAIRLVGAGDKFLSQVDLTISLGQGQQEKGTQARQQRYNINDSGPAATGTAQGYGQLHYWTVGGDGDGGALATKHFVELKASGNDSLVSDRISNSTQFDVGKSVEELQQWKADVRDKRDQAESTLGLGPAAGHSTT